MSDNSVIRHAVNWKKDLSSMAEEISKLMKTPVAKRDTDYKVILKTKTHKYKEQKKEYEKLCKLSHLGLHPANDRFQTPLIVGLKLLNQPPP